MALQHATNANFPPFGVVELDDGILLPVVIEQKGGEPMVELLAAVEDALRNHPERSRFRAAARVMSGQGMKVGHSGVMRMVMIQVEEPRGTAQMVIIPTAKGLYGSLLLHEREVGPGKPSVFV